MKEHRGWEAGRTLFLDPRTGYMDAFTRDPIEGDTGYS